MSQKHAGRIIHSRPEIPLMVIAGLKLHPKNLTKTSFHCVASLMP